MTAAQRKPIATERRAVPRLDLSAPLRLVAAAAFGVVCLLGVGATVSLDHGPIVTVSARVRAEPILVRHPDGGVVARFAVKEGTDVEAGALIAILDSRLIDSQIAGLKRQMDGIQLHVSGLKQEAEALAASDRQSAQRQRLAGLEAQIAASEQESLGLQVRLAMAEQEKTRTAVRAPLAGRIVRLAAHEAASVLPSGVIAELQPAPDRLVLEATLPKGVSGDVANGQHVSVWPAGRSAWPAALTGRVEHVASDATGARLRVVVDLTGTDLAGERSGERVFTLQVATGTTSLLASFLSPLTSGPSVTRSRSKDQP